ncbi:MAG: DUF1175 family protein [Clostridia bacterium]|nr:DUF1175 family protein [Deltaproteobacteria bacterium]
MTSQAGSPAGTRGASAFVDLVLATGSSPAQAAVGATANGPLLRSIITDTANAQLVRMDDAWPVEQRDCAGLVRFVYRKAYARLSPGEVRRGLFLASGRYSAFADARTLLYGGSFKALGRSPALRESLITGDLVAFRRADDDDAVYHLMLIVRPQDRAHDAAWVVYHPGSRDQGVRGGPLRDLERDAPREWQPVPENPAFLGYFRFEEWMR